MDASKKKGASRDTSTRREELRSAAARVFADKGYHGASMQDIADEIGILKGSLYHYVRSKDELLHDVLIHLLDRGVSELERINALEVSPSEQLRLALRSILANFVNEPEPARVFGHGMRSVLESSFPDVQEKARAYRELVATIIEKGVTAGNFRPVDSRIAALALLGMTGSVHYWYRPEGRLKPEEISDVLAQLVLQGLEK